MADARVRIILEDECYGGFVTGDTWVVVVPVRRSYSNRPHDVVRAVGEAAGMFVESVIRDRDAIDKKLTELEARDA